MIDMINHHIIPSVKAAGVGNSSALTSSVNTLKNALKTIHGTEDLKRKADLCRNLRLQTMVISLFQYYIWLLNSFVAEFFRTFI
jgi:hypothetical protein